MNVHPAGYVVDAYTKLYEMANCGFCFYVCWK